MQIVKNLLLLTFVVLMTACASPSSEYRSKDIQIDSIKIETRDVISYVVGDAKNTSSETLHLVELHFHLFDSQDKKLGEAVEYKDEMGPNST